MLATTTVPSAAAVPEADPEVLAALERERARGQGGERDYGGLVGGGVAASLLGFLSCAKGVATAARANAATRSREKREEGAICL